MADTKKANSYVSAYRLPVIFRAERSGNSEGEVTAVFPTLPGDNEYYFLVYAHVGQHGSGSQAWYYGTRPARPEEYAELLQELRDIYENDEHDPMELVVVKRFPLDAMKKRRAQIAMITRAAISEGAGNAKQAPGQER